MKQPDNAHSYQTLWFNSSMLRLRGKGCAWDYFNLWKKIDQKAKKKKKKESGMMKIYWINYFSMFLNKTHYCPSRLRDSRNRQIKQMVTQLYRRAEGAIITCHPSRHHVHLGRVWLQHSIQLFFGFWIGCKVDCPVGKK